MKDLTAFLAPDLVLKVGERTYTVPPPSKAVGLTLAAVNAAGVAAYLSLQDQCPTCGRAGAPEGLPDSTREILEAASDTDLGELSLGPAYQQMIDDGVPGAHIDTLALYAMYYWTVGEETADAILEAQVKAKDAPEGKGSAPGRRSPTGRSTGSGSRSRTSTGSRSTAGTGSRTD